jgi:hypothetical protein
MTQALYAHMNNKTIKKKSALIQDMGCFHPLDSETLSFLGF